jgi:hypothetical protein
MEKEPLENDIDDSASLKEDSTLLSKARVSDINTDTDSEGMCVEC